MNAKPSTLLTLALLLGASTAQAAGGGALSQPPVRTATGTEPAANGDAASLGTSPAPKLDGAEPATGAAIAHPGIDASTAAPGGHAESSRNGTLSTPPDITRLKRHNRKTGAAGS